MSIRRAPRKTTYTNIDNAVFNAGLSYRAIGLLCFLLSKPDHWEVSIGHLTKYSRDTANPIGRDAIYSVLRELEDKGFIVREQKRNEDGKMAGMDYVVFDQPQEGNCLPGIVPDEPEPLPGNPFTDKPSTAISTQVNTDTKVNTETAVTTEREPAHSNDNVATPEQLDTLFSHSTDTRRKFEMSFDWEPDRNMVCDRLRHTRVPVPPSDQLTNFIFEFRNHFEAQSMRQTEHQWIAKLVQWIKRDNVNQSERPKSKQRQPDNFGQIDYRAGAEEMGFEVI